MNIDAFEEAVWQIDGLRAVVRAPRRGEVKDYGNVNSAADTLSLTEYLRIRIDPKLDGHQAIVIDGRGLEPNGRMRLKRIRESYHREG